MHGSISGVVPGETAKLAVGVLAELDQLQKASPLHGFVAEGANPYAYIDDHAIDAALLKAVFSGAPGCRVARGNTGGFCYPSGPFFIAGSNLTSTKARVLLQAAVLKLGMLLRIRLRRVRARLAKQKEEQEKLEAEGGDGDLSSDNGTWLQTPSDDRVPEVATPPARNLPHLHLQPSTSDSHFEAGSNI